MHCRICRSTNITPERCLNCHSTVGIPRAFRAECPHCKAAPRQWCDNKSAHFSRVKRGNRPKYDSPDQCPHCRMDELCGQRCTYCRSHRGGPPSRWALTIQEPCPTCHVPPYEECHGRFTTPHPTRHSGIAR